MKKIFFEPEPFDLVEWVHGIGMLPFVEEGTVTDQKTWRDINRMFGGNFLGFAIWFN